MADTNSDNLREEFRLLGKNLQKIINSAWASPERARVEEELMDGLNDLRDSLRDSFHDFAQSETGKQLKENMENLNEKIKSGEIGNDIRTEIAGVLRKINSELENTSDRWQFKDDSAQ